MTNKPWWKINGSVAAFWLFLLISKYFGDFFIEILRNKLNPIKWVRI